MAGPVNGCASFLESGLIDSTGILELVTFLESTYSIRIAEEGEVLPENLDSIERIMVFVRRKMRWTPETGPLEMLNSSKVLFQLEGHMSSSPKRHSATFKPKSPPGAALGAGRSRNPPRRGRLGPSCAAWGRQARGGGSAAGTVEDSVGQQATLTSCQPGSDTPRLTRRTLGRGPPAIGPGPHDHSTAGPPAWAVRKPTASAGGITAAGKLGHNPR